jgi:hypothetical protein
MHTVRRGQSPGRLLAHAKRTGWARFNLPGLPRPDRPRPVPRATRTATGSGTNRTRVREAAPRDPRHDRTRTTPTHATGHTRLLHPGHGRRTRPVVSLPPTRTRTLITAINPTCDHLDHLDHDHADHDPNPMTRLSFDAQWTRAASKRAARQQASEHEQRAEQRASSESSESSERVSESASVRRARPGARRGQARGAARAGAEASRRENVPAPVPSGLRAPARPGTRDRHAQ